MKTQTRLVRRSEAAQMFNVSVNTIDRMKQDGRLPAPIKLGPRVCGWREEVLIDLLKSREAEACAK